MIMKRLSFRLAIAVVTFLIGVGLVFLWFYYRPANVHNVQESSSDCYPIYVDSFDASYYKGTVTRPVYTISINKTDKPILEEEVNAEATANIFKLFREVPLTSEPPHESGEKPLTSSAACVEEVYRLTWIPTFHAPTVIRVWRSKDQYYIVTKRLNGKGGYGLGTLETERSHSLTVEEWQSFKSLIAETAFWTSPSSIKESVPNDGASWRFEALRDGKYHCIQRLTPSKELGQIFEKLFELSDVETEYKRYL